MNDIIYSLVLTANYPGEPYQIEDNDYDKLEWFGSVPKPSQAELDALWPQVRYDGKYEQVEVERHDAYTAAGGPDSIFLRYQRGDATEQEWLDAVQAVKDAHPYPDPV